MPDTIPAPDAAVELDAVARRFGRRWVLRGVSLRVEAGEAVALMGRNGSGKTTLLRIVSTLLHPTRGTGRVFGHDLRRGAAEIRERVGLLGHSAGLYDDLTALENLSFAARMYGRRAEARGLERALEEVGLAAERDTRVRGFSAGMRRRLALARLLLRPPRLLLLDEPYSAFDADGIRKVNDVVREVVGAGGAAIIATHDLSRAAAVAERVVRIDDGLVREGPPDVALEAEATARGPLAALREGGR